MPFLADQIEEVVMTAPTKMTFFSRFEADILAGKKTITIRDESEKDYQPGTTVEVSTLEEGRVFCQLKILSVEPIAFSALNQFHAEQENMTLETLKEVIQEIYPGIEQLYVIQYQRV
ncbi:TPA: ASCH domain-containing protein [Vibrio vulnificus]|uniref:N(4)-acetylcytidine amidohydrolase n=1 Tax=Vibrio vulnificus TaxID=672 RepID=A0ABX4X2C6_VIBVL|nr:ASCH domain-containing protein [Vibrio vulnificus]EGQ7982269.1 ASCH domain-containing protein [Vibrio vulnificus]EGQ9276012.1 ASCH domain-containing protein [Vibrio vulnificus]EGQ9937596.1 ASCH domain-containing protein [Vibrio vulnificus]EGR0054105.1 ASCH domain-containing protein [Vibrio vulnificus]